MATELAAAYVSLVVSTRGVGKEVKRTLGDVEGGFDQVGKRGGKAIGSGIGKGLKVATVAAGGLAATVAGIALKGGVSRALNIEDAQAKLKGLGHSTKSIEKIMDSALASAKGTAFGLGDAATVAASTVAAGVKPGKDLTRTLKLVADASTIAGTSMSDMGLIFNKVAGTGKIQGEVIAQLGERGIPILQLLADEMGVSAGEVAKLASAGKIGFSEFQNAMEKGMGGAALQSGKTARGAWANMLAALSRVGEKVVGKHVPTITAAFGTITEWADKIAPAAERAGDALGDAFVKVGDYLSTTMIPRIVELADAASKALVPALRDTGSWVSRNQGWLKPLAVAVGAMAVAMAAWVEVTKALAIAQGVLNVLMAANPIGLVVVAVAGLVAGLVYLWNTNEGFKNALLTAWAAIQTAIGAVVAWWQTSVAPVLTAVWDAIKTAATSVADWYMTHVAPVFQAAGELIKAYIERVGAIFGWLWGYVKPYLTLLVDYWSTVWSGVKAVWDKVGPPIISAVSAGFKNLWTIIKGVWNGIKGTIETALGVIKGVMKAATAILKGDWSGAWNAIKGIADTIWGGLKKGFQNAMDTIGSVMTTLKDKVLGAVADAGTWLYEAGKDIVRGAINGVKDMAGAAADAVKGVGSSMVSGFKGMLGIKSPSRVFAALGKFVVQGLAVGITSDRQSATKAIEAVGKALTQAGEKAVKSEADRLIAARKKANDKIRAANKSRAKGAKARDLLPTLSRADAEKQAKKNVASTLAGTKAAQKLINAQAKTTGATRSGLLAGLTSSGAVRKNEAGRKIGGFTLADIAKARESVATSIKAAKQTLDDLKKGRADLAAQVASSIRGELDLTAGIGQDTTTPWGHTVAGKTTFESVSGVVKALAAKAKAFAGKLKALIAKGIPAGLVQEVASLGSEKGAQVADALLSGSGARVKELAADYASLGKWSDAAGDYVAGSMYDVGIAAQQGIVDGLLADDKKLEAAAKNLASKLTKAVKKELGIKSPSRVFRDEVGAMVSRGVIVGMDREQANLDRRVANLASVPDVAIGASSGGGAEARSLTDADIEALAWAMSQVQVKAAYDNRVAADIAQRGIREASRSDRGSMLQSLGVRS